MDVDYNLQDSCLMDIDNITLSNIGILSLDIIIKEFSNIPNIFFTSSEYIDIICSNIWDYLEGKDVYLLSYTCKKAIDIIKIEYIYYINSNILILEAIRKYLNSYNDTIKIKCNKRQNTSSDDMNTLKKRHIMSKKKVETISMDL